MVVFPVRSESGKFNAHLQMVDVGASRSVPEGSCDTEVIIAGAGSIAELMTSVIAAESRRRPGINSALSVSPSADSDSALLEIGSIALLSHFGGNYV
jgi:hypothetical protein